MANIDPVLKNCKQPYCQLLTPATGHWHGTAHESIYRGYGETEAVSWLLRWLVSLSSVAGAPVHPRYFPVTVTSSLVCVGPGPVHVSLGPVCVDTVPVHVILSPVWENYSTCRYIEEKPTSIVTVWPLACPRGAAWAGRRPARGLTSPAPGCQRLRPGACCHQFIEILLQLSENFWKL